MPGAAGHTHDYDVQPSVVIDRVTRLEWQRTIDTAVHTWTDAMSYCAGLLLDGKSDWRLPSRIELLSIVDYTQTGPAIDRTAFPGTPPVQFWTASVQFSPSPPSTNAWWVHFNDGADGAYLQTDTYRVRCVR
jgi:hypothetical protein